MGARLCAWCHEQPVPDRLSWFKGGSRPVRFCSRRCACRWVTSQRTPETTRRIIREAQAARIAVQRQNKLERFRGMSRDEGLFAAIRYGYQLGWQQRDRAARREKGAVAA